MMKKKRKFLAIEDFFKGNRCVCILGIISFIFCSVCNIFKACPLMNIPEYFRPFGEFMYNIAISVIAAVIFFYVQVFLANRKRNSILRAHIKDVMNEICKQCLLLESNLQDVVNKNKSEDEMCDLISDCCDKIKSYIYECVHYYVEILPENCVNAMLKILTNDYFYSIDLRAKRKLKGENLAQIRSTDILYEDYLKLTKIIEETKNTLR